MSKIDNPMFGKVGAFWVKGKNEPFYGITEARGKAPWGRTKWWKRYVEGTCEKDEEV